MQEKAVEHVIHHRTVVDRKEVVENFGTRIIASIYFPLDPFLHPIFPSVFVQMQRVILQDVSFVAGKTDVLIDLAHF